MGDSTFKYKFLNKIKSIIVFGNVKYRQTKYGVCSMFIFVTYISNRILNVNMYRITGFGNKLAYINTTTMINALK